MNLAGASHSLDGDSGEGGAGTGDLAIAARRALLDALDALHAHLEAVVVIGAQAIYLHSGAAPVALDPATKDSDLALDARVLAEEPRLELAMREAGFHLDVESPQPGSWLSSDGIPVDLMVPESIGGNTGRRGARIPPHAKNAARRAAGLEATVIDNVRLEITSLDPNERRSCVANVAGQAALLIAKAHKLGERRRTPSRLVDKDAHDIYRLLVATPTDQLAESVRRLRADEFAGAATEQAMEYLIELFATVDSIGSTMAGRAEEYVGEPDTVAATCTILIADLVAAAG